MRRKIKNRNKKCKQYAKKSAQNLIPKSLRFYNNFIKKCCNLLIIIILVQNIGLKFYTNFSFFFSHQYILKAAGFWVTRNKAPT